MAWTQQHRDALRRSRIEKTQREIAHIMLAMCAGVTMQAIARRAHISSSGISQRVTAACGRYGVSTRIELLVVLLQRELLTLDDLRPENLQQVREQFEFTPTTRS